MTNYCPDCGAKMSREVIALSDLMAILETAEIERNESDRIEAEVESKVYKAEVAD